MAGASVTVVHRQLQPMLPQLWSTLVKVTFEHTVAAAAPLPSTSRQLLHGDSVTHHAFDECDASESRGHGSRDESNEYVTGSDGGYAPPPLVIGDVSATTGDVVSAVTDGGAHPGCTSSYSATVHVPTTPAAVETCHDHGGVMHAPPVQFEPQVRVGPSGQPCAVVSMAYKLATVHAFLIRAFLADELHSLQTHPCLIIDKRNGSEQHCQRSKDNDDGIRYVELLNKVAAGDRAALTLVRELMLAKWAAVIGGASPDRRNFWHRFRRRVSDSASLFQPPAPPAQGSPFASHVQHHTDFHGEANSHHDLHAIKGLLGTDVQHAGGQVDTVDHDASDCHPQSNAEQRWCRHKLSVGQLERKVNRLLLSVVNPGAGDDACPPGQVPAGCSHFQRICCATGCDVSESAAMVFAIGQLLQPLLVDMCEADVTSPTNRDASGRFKRKTRACATEQSNDHHGMPNNVGSSKKRRTVLEMRRDGRQEGYQRCEFDGDTPTSCEAGGDVQTSCESSIGVALDAGPVSAAPRELQDQGSESGEGHNTGVEVFGADDGHDVTTHGGARDSTEQQQGEQSEQQQYDDNVCASEAREDQPAVGPDSEQQHNNMCHQHQVEGDNGEVLESQHHFHASECDGEANDNEHHEQERHHLHYDQQQQEHRRYEHEESPFECSTTAHSNTDGNESHSQQASASAHYHGHEHDVLLCHDQCQQGGGVLGEEQTLDGGRVGDDIQQHQQQLLRQEESVDHSVQQEGGATFVESSRTPPAGAASSHRQQRAPAPNARLSETRTTTSSSTTARQVFGGRVPPLMRVLLYSLCGTRNDEAMLAAAAAANTNTGTHNTSTQGWTTSAECAVAGSAAMNTSGGEARTSISRSRSRRWKEEDILRQVETKVEHMSAAALALLSARYCNARQPVSIPPLE
jgi:hypothetical protein